MNGYGALVNASLEDLSHSGSQALREAASRELVDLGVISDGTTPSGWNFVVPAPWVQHLFPNWRLLQRKPTLISEPSGGK